MRAAGILSHLKELLDETTAPLSDVTQLRMFGCDAFFGRGSIFALVWKTGRIAVKLPTETDFSTALALDGSEQWSPMGEGRKPMSSWVLLPEELHDDETALSTWVHRAHAQALTKKAAAAKKKPVKRAR